MTPPPAISGLYVITDPQLIPDHRLLDSTAAAIAGGARIVQYRNKHADPGQQRQQAEQLQHLCRARGCLFIVNDDIELAARIHADGLHLGQHDGALPAARERLSGETVIGISCHNSLHLAQQAQRDGANYVAFGRFFESRTKPGAPPADADILSRAREQLQLPLVAIGGITPENGASLIDRGADALAVIHGVFGQTDIQRAARRYSDLF